MGLPSDPRACINRNMYWKQILWFIYIVYVCIHCTNNQRKVTINQFHIHLNKIFQKVKEIEKIECAQRKRFHALKIKDSLPFGGIQKIGVERKSF